MCRPSVGRAANRGDGQGFEGVGETVGLLPVTEAAPFTAETVEAGAMVGTATVDVDETEDDAGLLTGAVTATVTWGTVTGSPCGGCASK